MPRRVRKQSNGLGTPPTAFYRYPHYHLPSDTPEKLDYLRMARVTLGLAGAIKELANEGR